MHIPAFVALPSVTRLALFVWLLLTAAATQAATPASENFNNTNGPGISSRIIGSWQFRLLDSAGDDDNGGYDFVDIIDDTYTNATALASGSDNALSLIGSTNAAVAAQVRSRDRSPFRLVSFAIDGDDLTYVVTGYAAGLPVAGATHSFFAPFLAETVVTLTNTAFQNIEEFRISRQDGVADIWIYLDDIVVTNPVAASAAPVISNLNGDSALFMEGGPAARLDTLTAATVTDSDSPDFHGGAIVVGIVSGRIPPQDALLIVHQGTAAGQVGISGTNVTYGGTVVGFFRGGSSYDDLIIALNNNASKTAARDILRRLAYTNTATGVPITRTRGLVVRLYDGDGGYTSVSNSVAVQVNNNPPTITTTTSTNLFTEGYNAASVAIAVDSGVIINDVDDTTLSNATISITRNFNSNQDRLVFTNVPGAMGNIAASYDTNSGVLVLESAGAAATIAEWRAALRTVGYLNISDAPSTSQRTVTFVLSDGSDTSGPATRAINIADANDTPGHTFPGALLTTLMGAPVTFLAASNTVSIADPDAGNASIQVALSASTGVVTLASIEGLSFLIGTGTDDAIVGMLGHLTNINAALDGLTFSPPPGFFGEVTINIFTSDFGASGAGGHQLASDNIRIFVTPPPARVLDVAATNANGTLTLGATAGIAVQFNQPVFVDTSGGVPALELNVGSTNRHPAPYLSGSGTDTLFFLYTVQPGHQTVELSYAVTNALVLNGGAISNSVAESASLDLPAPAAAGSLDANTDLAVDGILPFVVSITRVGPSTINGTNATFQVLLSEAVNGVDANDFTLTVSPAGGTVVVESLANLGSSNRLFAVAVAAFVTEASLRLDLNDSGTAIADLAGQAITGGFTNGESVTIDRVDPAAPVITTISDDTGTAGDLLTADTTILLHGTAESNALVTITRVGTGVVGTTNASESGQWTFDYTTTLLPVGDTEFRATATDAAGNGGSAFNSILVTVFDNILPTVESITRRTASPSQPTNVLFRIAFSEPISGIDGADFELVVTGTTTGVVQSVTQTGLFSQEFDVLVGTVTGDGTLRLDLKDSGTGITDLAGQAITNGYASGETCVIDGTAPDAPMLTGISQDTGIDGDFTTADATLVFYGTAEPGSIVRLSLVATGEIGTTNADNSGAWIFDYTGTVLPDGTNLLALASTDDAGNSTAAPSPFAIVVDRSLRLHLLTPPTLFVIKKPAVKIDPFALLDAGARAEFGGGNLTVTVATNHTANDLLTIINDTNGGPGIRLAGTNVHWGDLLIANFSRALPTVSNSVTFAFTTNATPSAVQALAREIAFSSTNASQLNRSIRFALTDGFGTAAPDVFKTIVINKLPTLTSVTNRFNSAPGTFTGLILRTNDVVVGEGGAFQIKVTPGLAFSGTLFIAGGRGTFSGRFNTNGEASVLTSGNKWGIDLALDPDGATVRGRLTGYASGGWTSDLLGHKTALATTNFNLTRAGTYTLLLPSSNSPEVGSGWATFTIDRLGNAKLKGTLGDGLGWSAGIAIGTNGHWPLAIATDRKRGVLLGWMVFSNTVPATFRGTLTWLKPATTPYFTNGIAAELNTSASRYTVPVGTNGILASTNINVAIRGGNVSGVRAGGVTVTPTGRFVSSSGQITNLTLSINAKSGSFSGSFVHPATGRSAKHSGVVMQNFDGGGGFFLGTNRGGILILNPVD